MRASAIAAVVAAILPAVAHADELSDVKSELDSAVKSIRELQKRMRVLEAEKAKAAAENAQAAAEKAQAAAEKAQAAAEWSASRKFAAPPVVEVQPAPTMVAGAPVVAPDLVPANPVPGAENARLEIHGAVELDAIYDLKKVDPNWEGTLRPSKIPVNCPPVGTDPGCGKNGVTNFNARASYIDIKGFFPTEAGEVKTELAFDLWGGAQQGQTWPRLIQAWGSFREFLFGYTNSLFMDIDVFPNTIDFWGPSGMMFLRDPQIRWTLCDQNGVKLALALEVPQAAIDEGHIADQVPGFDVLEKPRYPDLTGNVRWGGSWGHVQLASVTRLITFDTPAGIDGNPAATVFGWGVNLTAKLITFGKDAIKGQIAYGHGIAAYSNDCCFDLGPNHPLPNAKAEALPLLNWFVYYDHWWSSKWSSSIGYSENNQTNSGGETDDAQHIGRYASANLLYYPYQNVKMGVEGLWGERINKNGESGQDERVQFSTQVKF